MFEVGECWNQGLCDLIEYESEVEEEGGEEGEREGCFAKLS